MNRNVGAAVLVLALAAAPAHAQEERMVEVNGYLMRVRTSGLESRKPGEPVVVFENGAVAPLETWGEVPARVAAFSPVIVYDRSTIGESEWDGELGIPSHVTDRLWSLLRTLKADPPYVLVGWSWGGDLIRYHAGTHPADVVGLVHVDPAGHSPSAALAVLHAIGLGEDEYAIDVKAMEGGLSTISAAVQADVIPINRIYVERREPEYGAVPRVPTAVLLSGRRRPPTSDEIETFGRTPYDRQLHFEAKLRNKIQRLSEWALAVPHGVFAVIRSSDHAIQKEEPALVTDFIRRVVAAAGGPRHGLRAGSQRRNPMLTRPLPTLMFMLLLLGGAAAEAQVQPQLAQRYFDEATRLCERDAGRLWGVSLCGPIVIVDPATGTRATSRPEPEGEPPRFSGFADGPVSWGGERWFAFPLQMLPEDDADARQQLMLHGLFHRIQPELGLITEDGFNEHLDTLEGRVWMQLEWRALRRAVESSGNDRAEAIADALAFRRERRRLFPDAADNERRDEIREGLATYTGIAAWADSPADARRAAASALAGAESMPAFVGQFEAASGPAYGVLLDELRPGWRREVRASSDLGDLLASANNSPPATDVAVAAARYDGATLRAAEEARDRAQQIRVAEMRRRFVDGPVLTMPAAGSGTFDTRGSVGIPGVGTVLFNDFTLSARWGRLTANDGVLRSADGTTLSVPVTVPLEGTTLQGDGWSATLNAGWVVRPAARPGSFAIVREN